ncbi:MAG: HEAT repeat domain-containing protein [Moorea sp. SIO1G6]|uniref:HEAT repeat domain-containing protein n=1 Tax=Moorena sp. SIO1G6 TaxID=2607840 RepID=UPI0013C07D46|nr:HEAT repeat domain-containing protein [Moorena sp. SIO1G6]NET65681.1 HEAT repeat domain-containing protein [Moorena sp. SIO1G6]
MEEIYIKANCHNMTLAFCFPECFCKSEMHPTLALLQQSARCDTDSDMRATAMEQLAQAWQDHRDALRLLQQSARSDTDSRVRLKVLEQLTLGWQNHRDSITLLQEWARSDTDSDLRDQVIEQLIQGWQDHRDTLALLQEWARSDPDSRLRATAIKQLAQGWKDHPYILPLLQEWAGCYHYSFEQLPEAGQDQPWLWEFLCDRTVNDPFEHKGQRTYNPRKIALEAILKYYPNHSQTRSLLQDRAEHDSDPELRKFAKDNLECRI